MKTLASDLFRKIVDEIREAVFVVDLEGIVLFANDAACRLTGKSLQDLIGVNVLDEFITESGGVSGRSIVSLFEGGGEGLSIPLWTRESGTACDARLVAVVEGPCNGNEYCLIVEDVTESVEASEKLVECLTPDVAVLLISDFVHDMKNIILGVSGYVAMAMEVLEEGHPVYSDLKDIASSMEELGKMIERYSRVGRCFSGRKEDVRIRDVVEDAVCRMKRIAGPGVRFEVAFEGKGDECARVSRANLEEVLARVIQNACDAVRGSGVIRVEVAPSGAWEGTPYFEEGGSKRRYCCIKVIDDGRGIDAIDLDRLFEPFFTTTMGTKHLGLGLTVAQSILRSMEGHIKIEPASGGGTEVSLYIPLKI